MKSYLLNRLTRSLPPPANVPTVWNGVTYGDEDNNVNTCPIRNNKRQVSASGPPDYATCSPSSSSSSSSAAASSTSESITTTPPPSSTSSLALPTLTSHCSSSSLVNCQWFYNSVTSGPCPTITEPIPASCTATSTSSSSTALPTQNVDQGILTCGPEATQGNPTTFMTPAGMNDAVSNFCAYLKNNGVIFLPGTHIGGQNTQNFHYNNGANDPIYLAATWIDSPTCPTLDFHAEPTGSVNICAERLGDPINLCMSQLLRSITQD